MAELLATVFVVWLIVRAVRSGRRAKPRATRPAAGPARPGQPAPPGRPSDGDFANGILLGHAVAHDRTGFPGDPLPGGHLGSAADLAFWGGVFDAEDEEEPED